MRRVSLTGGGETVERLVGRDDARRYSYALVEGPLPVSESTATLAVDDEPAGSARVSWWSEFTPAGASQRDAETAIRQFLQAGLASLRQKFDRERA